MATEATIVSADMSVTKEQKGLGFFEKYLYIWVILCILAGILLGKVAPGVAKYLDGLAIRLNFAKVHNTFANLAY